LGNAPPLFKAAVARLRKSGGAVVIACTVGAAVSFAAGMLSASRKNNQTSPIPSPRKIVKANSKMGQMWCGGRVAWVFMREILEEKKRALTCPFLDVTDPVA
jgi:hypothetical protein